MSEPLTLDTLPSDVLVIIALCTDLKSALALSTTCRLFYDLIKNSVVIQLRLELEAQGVLLNPNLRPGHPSSEWYRRLVQTRDDWINLKLTSLPPLKLSLEDNGMFSAVQGGVFTCGANTPRQSDGINRVKVVKLPSYESLEDSEKSQSYLATTVLTGKYLSAFRTSSEQDLLVIGALGYNGPCLTIHTLSGAPHPLAKNATLEFRTSGFMAFAVHDPQPIQIQGDLVSALLYSSRAGPLAVDWAIVVWNWKTGSIVFQKGGAAHDISFSFLSPESYILVERDLDSTHLLIDNLDSQLDTTAPRFKLKLPELSAGWTYGSLHFKSDLPSLPRDSYQSTQAFLPDPVTGVIYLSVGLSGLSLVSGRSEHNLHLGLFIGREALRRKLLNLGASTCEPVELDWNQWGEDVSRWIELGSRPGLLSAVHGSRYVQLARGERSAEAWLQVLDFGPTAVHREQAPAENGNNFGQSQPARICGGSTTYEELWVALGHPDKRASAGSVLVGRYGYDRPTVLDIPGAFLHRVVSRLPYRCATQIEPMHASSEWMIDGDLLFEVKEGAGCCVVYPYRISDRSGEV